MVVVFSSPPTGNWSRGCLLAENCRCELVFVMVYMYSSTVGYCMVCLGGMTDIVCMYVATGRRDVGLVPPAQRSPSCMHRWKPFYMFWRHSIAIGQFELGLTLDLYFHTQRSYKYASLRTYILKRYVLMHSCVQSLYCEELGVESQEEFNEWDCLMVRYSRHNHYLS